MSHHYINFCNVGYSYPDGHRALAGVSFRIGHGEKVAVIGPNGAGKSTLMLLLDGLLLPTEGSICIGGIEVERSTLKLIRQSVGIVFQNPDDQLFMPTVEEDVAFGPLNMGLPPEQVEQRVTEALACVGIEELRHRAPYRLSGGEKRRAAIATVLSMQPSVLVMDEPTAGLDPEARRQIIELLKQFDHTCLVATHDMEFAEEVCTRYLTLNKGRTEESPLRVHSS
ncbi:MAG: ABC transporter ATP-binding protein [Tidjanibacter sp.]|nr:ABC transporter ATP-binding protein [Tidjanibacter sp.]